MRKWGSLSVECELCSQSFRGKIALSNHQLKCDTAFSCDSSLAALKCESSGHPFVDKGALERHNCDPADFVLGL